MLDIELFSEFCWCGERPRIWNKRTGRGIIYRGYGHILDTTAPYHVIVRRDERYSRSFTWGT